MVRVMELLQAAGSNPLLATDALGRSALHFAAAKGAMAAASSLLDIGLLPFLLDRQRNGPLHLAGENAASLPLSFSSPSRRAQASLLSFSS